MNGKIIAAIVGGSLCGKTSLAIAISRRERARRDLRSLVYDPFKHEHHWGAWAWVTKDLAHFKRAVLGSKGCAIFWDESTTSLKPTTDEDKAFFVNMRHNHHAMFVVAHDLKVMTPVMLGSLTDAYVFRQSRPRAREWCELFADEGMMAASQLQQYEFIYKRPFGPPAIQRPSKQDLQHL